MLIAAQAQDIEVGPVRVDTGDPVFDLGAAIVLFAVFVAGVVIINRTRRKP